MVQRRAEVSSNYMKQNDKIRLFACVCVCVCVCGGWVGEQVCGWWKSWSVI